MSYSKLPLAIQDYALGFQSVNQARDNAAQLLSDFGQKHGRYFVQPPRPWQKIGRHDDLLVPRGVYRADVSIIYTGVPYFYAIAQSPGIVVAAARFSVGNYLFATSHMGANQWCDVSVQGNATAPRFANARFFTLTTPTAYSGILVQLYALDAGAFVPDDYSFSLRFRSMNA